MTRLLRGLCLVLILLSQSTAPVHAGVFDPGGMTTPAADGKTYGIKDGEWVEIESVSDGNTSNILDQVSGGETNKAKVLKPNGTGGVEWGTDQQGSGGSTITNYWGGWAFGGWIANVEEVMISLGNLTPTVDPYSMLTTNGTISIPAVGLWDVTAFALPSDWTSSSGGPPQIHIMASNGIPADLACLAGSMAGSTRVEGGGLLHGTIAITNLPCDLEMWVKSNDGESTMDVDGSTPSKTWLRLRYVGPITGLEE